MDRLAVMSLLRESGQIKLQQVTIVLIGGMQIQFFDLNWRAIVGATNTSSVSHKVVIMPPLACWNNIIPLVVKEPRQAQTPCRCIPRNRCLTLIYRGLHTSKKLQIVNVVWDFA